MHCGPCEVTPDAGQQHLIPLAGHAVARFHDRKIDVFGTIGVRVGGTDITGIGHPIQVVIGGRRHEGAVGRHDNVVPLALAAENVDQAIVVDVQQSDVVAVRHPVKVGVAVGVGKGAVLVFVNRHAPPTVARGDVHVHIAHHHIDVPVEVQICCMNVAPKSIGGAEAQIHHVKAQAFIWRS